MTLEQPDTPALEGEPHAEASTISARCTPQQGHVMRYGDSRCECGEVRTYAAPPTLEADSLAPPL